MKTLLFGLAVMVAPVLGAQQPSDTNEAGRLRTQIESTFTRRVQQDLNLSQDQQARYQQMRERLMQRVGELRMQRREEQGMGRGRGMGTGRPGINRGPRRRGI